MACKVERRVFFIRSLILILTLFKGLSLYTVILRDTCCIHRYLDMILYSLINIPWREPIPGQVHTIEPTRHQIVCHLSNYRGWSKEIQNNMKVCFGVTGICINNKKCIYVALIAENDSTILEDSLNVCEYTYVFSYFSRG